MERFLLICHDVDKARADLCERLAGDDAATDHVVFLRAVTACLTPLFVSDSLPLGHAEKDIWLKYFADVGRKIYTLRSY